VVALGSNLRRAPPRPFYLRRSAYRASELCGSRSGARLPGCDETFSSYSSDSGLGTFEGSRFSRSSSISSAMASASGNPPFLKIGTSLNSSSQASACSEDGGVNRGGTESENRAFKAADKELFHIAARLTWPPLSRFSSISNFPLTRSRKALASFK